MADMYGRLTQRAGVCLGTLGPGATNLVTAVADAFLDRSPLVALTGQGDLERMHKESHQYIDVVSLMRADHQVERPADARPRSSPRSCARRSRSPRQQKPGPTHVELPEDVMARDGRRRAAARAPRAPPARAERRRAAARHRDHPRRRATRSCWPATASRAPAPPPALREFARATGIGVAETFMGKGVLDYEDPRALGTVGLQSRDYALAGFEDADVVITVGYDLVEHAPAQLEPASATRGSSASTPSRPRSTSTSSPRST